MDSLETGLPILIKGVLCFVFELGMLCSGTAVTLIIYSLALVDGTDGTARTEPFLCEPQMNWTGRMSDYKTVLIAVIFLAGLRDLVWSCIALFSEFFLCSLTDCKYPSAHRSLAMTTPNIEVCGL
jgi:hypothetical protein